jgi:lactoylglutathione lyase
MHIEHIAIWTCDLERLKTFYETYFEARADPKYCNPAHRFESYFLHFASGARLELMHMPSIPTTRNDREMQFTGLIHLAFSVGSEKAADALTDRLRQDGYYIVAAPRRTGDGYYESVVLDPDGNRIEITV